MADALIAFPQSGSGSGAVVPIRAVELGDGTYAIAANTGTASGVLVSFPAVGSAGAGIVMDTVLLAGGNYALKIGP